MSSKPCLETLPGQVLQTPSAGHCLDTHGNCHTASYDAERQFMTNYVLSPSVLLWISQVYGPDLGL